MAEAHNVGVSGAGGMTHPTEGGGVVSFHEENPAVGLWEVGRGERVVKGKRAHHEEGIYDDADELVDVDVPCWCRDRLIFPGWETAKGFVRETPLKEESKGETSHGDVAGI